MKNCLKWVHMVRYELILRLVRGLWLTIIFKPLLTPKRAIIIQFESYLGLFVTEKVSMIWNVTFIGQCHVCPLPKGRDLSGLAIVLGSA